MIHSSSTTVVISLPQCMTGNHDGGDVTIHAVSQQDSFPPAIFIRWSRFGQLGLFSTIYNVLLQAQHPNCISHQAICSSTVSEQTSRHAVTGRIVCYPRHGRCTRRSQSERLICQSMRQVVTVSRHSQLQQQQQQPQQHLMRCHGDKQTPTSFVGLTMEGIPRHVTIPEKGLGLTCAIAQTQRDNMHFIPPSAFDDSRERPQNSRAKPS